jgi:cytochrome c oxidase cbb3-type subunit III
MKRALSGVAAVAVLAAACDTSGQPARSGRAQAPPGGHVTVPYVQTTGFQAGLYVDYEAPINPYAGFEREGERFYRAMNCDGCHGGAGGGGIGPPFLTAELIYGHQPGNIFQSIVQGRPQGMPAYGGKIPDEVVWKIVAYVESLQAPHREDLPFITGGRHPERAREDN